MTVRLGCIVEGHGEQESIRVLVKRLSSVLHPGIHVEVPIVLRVSRSRVIKPGELERSVELAARRVGPAGPLLILMDSDDDCPAQLGPDLLRRARSARSDRKISVVLAKREFEAWFLASALSLSTNFRAALTDRLR